MKTLIVTIIITILNLVSFEVNAQSYTSESKRCGSCRMEVSVNSRVGMKCPHCGVIWGKENTNYSTKTNTSYNYDYSRNYTSATPISTCNVRSSPSTSSEVLAQASSSNTFNVIEVAGNWVKIKFSQETYYGNETAYGWIFKSLLFLN